MAAQAGGVEPGSSGQAVIRFRNATSGSGHSRQRQPILSVGALLLRPESGLEAGPATRGLAHVAERHRRAGWVLGGHDSLLALDKSRTSVSRVTLIH